MITIFAIRSEPKEQILEVQNSVMPKTKNSMVEGTQNRILSFFFFACATYENILKYGKEKRAFDGKWR